jgi:hypothetical protein
LQIPRLSFGRIIPEYVSAAPEATMSNRISIVFLCCSLLLVSQVNAKKNKKKQLLGDDILRAQRVLVVVHPDAGESLTQPWGNRNAMDGVESAIRQWGRFELVTDAQSAELIIAVRKGTKSGPIISHSPLDTRPSIYQPGVPDARVGHPQQPGRPPDLSEPLPGDSRDRSPQLGGQLLSSDDTFEVYRGGGDYPLDAAPVWRYIAKDSLNPPQVRAVEEFRKAIEESEKQSQHKP